MPASSYAAECLAGVGRVSLRGAAVAVHVDHAGNAGAQQPCSAQQRREPRRETPSQRERQQPGLEQPIADSLLDGRDAIAVMMGVDHAGHDRDAFRTQDRRARVPAPQRVPVADFGDRAVLDSYRRVVQHRIAIPTAGDDPPPSNQYRVAHRSFLPGTSARHDMGRWAGWQRPGRVAPAKAVVLGPVLGVTARDGPGEAPLGTMKYEWHGRSGPWERGRPACPGWRPVNERPAAGPRLFKRAIYRVVVCGR